MVRSIDQGDSSKETSQRYKYLARRVIKSLEKNNIKSEYVADRSQALVKVIEAIPPSATIGIGDSMALHQIGFFSWLEKEQRQVFNPFLWRSDGHLAYNQSELYEVMRQAMTADVFLAGSNAVTLDGKLVNVDGRGNRVAAMIFGPKKIILVIGANKIVKDVDEAITRLRFVAAPMNHIRHVEKHNAHFLSMGADLSELPCVTTGYCVGTGPWKGCTNPGRGCRKFVIIDGQTRGALSPEESGISVILVGESLGL